MRLRSIAPVFAALTALLAVGLGTASAEETGPNAWCFRPAIYWLPVATESYAPRIECEERELPSGGPAQWSSEATAELALAPDGWSLPSRSQGERTRWGWTHGYDASSGNTWIYGEMQRKQGESPSGSNAQPDVWLSVGCAESGELRLLLSSDVEPLHGEHAVVWGPTAASTGGRRPGRPNNPRPTWTCSAPGRRSPTSSGRRSGIRRGSTC